MRTKIGYFKRFYILRDEVIQAPPVNKYSKPVDIICIGGSASAGMGLKEISDRYSEQLQKKLPDYYILNDSEVGIPLSEVIFYLDQFFRINKTKYCVIFSGNNEYLGLINKNRYRKRTVFYFKYYTPKFFSCISRLSYSLHNLLIIAMDTLNLFCDTLYFEIAQKAADKEVERYELDKKDIFWEKIFFRLRVYELRILIKSHPNIHFIYVIPPTNYQHLCDIIPEISPQTPNLDGKIDRYWIADRYLITPVLRKILLSHLKNIKNLEIIDLDQIFLAKVNNNFCKTEKFFLDYCHLNPEGHLILAEILTSLIKTPKNQLQLT